MHTRFYTQNSRKKLITKITLKILCVWKQNLMLVNNPIQRETLMKKLGLDNEN